MALADLDRSACPLLPTGGAHGRNNLGLTHVCGWGMAKATEHRLVPGLMEEAAQKARAHVPRVGPGGIAEHLSTVDSLGLTLLQLARWALRPDTLE